MKKILKNKRFIFISLLLLVIFVPFVMYAENLDTEDSESWLAPVFNFVWLAIKKALLAGPNLLLTTALYVVSFILWITGIILNGVVIMAVSNMGTLINDVAAINHGWTTIRDLANIVFIFGLLYVAISKIIQYDKINTSKALRNIIIAALLINFSLFFTKIIIDISNSLATSFYNQIGESAGTIEDMGNGISGAIAKQLGVSAVWSTDGITDFFTTGEPFALLAKKALSIFLIIITIFIFLIMSFMLLFRFITIVFLMILSPFAFAGMILPQTKSLSQKWWGALTDQALFAPVLFVLLFISIDILGSLNTAISGTFKNDTLGGFLLGGVGATISFFVSAGFILGSVIMAKKFASVGGNASVEGAFKLARFTGRNTIGRVGRLAKSGERYERWKKSNSKIVRGAGRLGLGFANSSLGKGVAKASPALESASFDIRNIKKSEVVSDAIEGVSSALGSDFKVGKGIKDGSISQLRAKNIKDATETEKKKFDALNEDPRAVLAAEDRLKDLNDRLEKAEKAASESDEYKRVNTKIEDLKKQLEKVEKDQVTKEAELKEAIDLKDTPRIGQFQSELDLIKEGNRALKDSLREQESKHRSLVKNKAILEQQIKAAQEDVDDIKGVGDKDAKRRGIKTRKSRSEKAKLAFAKSIGERGEISRWVRLQTKRDVAAIRQNLEKAAGGKKSVKDTVESLLKDNNEIIGDDSGDNKEGK